MNSFMMLQRWLNDFVRRMIDKTLSNGDDAPSFIRSFVDAEGRDTYDRDELLFILRDMIIAGAESSSTTVMWAIVLLADHRDVQARLHDEIDAVVGAGGHVGQSESDVGGRRLPSLADRSRLPYVEATILEVMRFKTILPLGLPRETTREVEVNGYTIPAGTSVKNSLINTLVIEVMCLYGQNQVLIALCEYVCVRENSRNISFDRHEFAGAICKTFG
jgi:cytochrome P450